MKIEITCGNNYDGNAWEEMTINEKRACSVYPCEPEDAIIGRYLISCQEMLGFMRQAYNAGRNGEKFEVNIIEEE